MGHKFLDQYSLLHFSTGVIAYFIGIDFWTWFILHMLFEIIENSTCGMNFINNFTFWPGGKSQPDKFINSVGDQIFAMIGWLCASYLDRLGKKRRWFTY